MSSACPRATMLTGQYVRTHGVWMNGVSLHLRTMHRDGFTCTVYEKSSLYDGAEGELYDHANDPRQWRNLWDEPQYRSLKSDLIADLYDHVPPARSEQLSRVALV